MAFVDQLGLSSPPVVEVKLAKALLEFYEKGARLEEYENELTSARERLASDRPLVAAFPEGRQLPTRDEPELALVLVPSDRGDGAATGSAGTPDDAEPWVFPFDRPLPPAEPWLSMPNTGSW